MDGIKDFKYKLIPKLLDEKEIFLLKEYCKNNGLKMFAFVEKLITEKCKPKKGIYME